MSCMQPQLSQVNNWLCIFNFSPRPHFGFLTRCIGICPLRRNILETISYFWWTYYIIRVTLIMLTTHVPHKPILKQQQKFKAELGEYPSKSNTFGTIHTCTSVSPDPCTAHSRRRVLCPSSEECLRKENGFLHRTVDYTTRGLLSCLSNVAMRQRYIKLIVQRAKDIKFF